MKKCSIVLLTALIIGVGNQTFGMNTGMTTEVDFKLKSLELPMVEVETGLGLKIVESQGGGQLADLKQKQIFYREANITGLSIMKVEGKLIAIVSSKRPTYFSENNFLTSLEIPSSGTDVNRFKAFKVNDDDRTDLINFGKNSPQIDAYDRTDLINFGKNSPQIDAYENYLAFTVDSDSIRVQAFKFEKNRLEVIKDYEIPKVHRTQIKRIKLGEYVFGSGLEKKSEIAIAYNSDWPTLRLNPVLESARSKQKDEENIEMKDTYLFDFNNKSLVYGVIDEETIGFFKRRFKFGDIDINIRVKNRWGDFPIGDFTMPIKEVLTNIFAATRNDVTIVIRQGKASIFWFMKQEFKEAKEGRSFGIGDLKLDDRTLKIQKIYLVNNEKQLIIVANSGILLFDVTFDENLDNVRIQKNLPKYGPFNIQASCMEDDKLFIIHKNKTEKDKDNDYQLFEFDLASLQ
jgi:hypothetical protein